MSDVESVTLTFFAPVPRGHEIHYATLRARDLPERTEARNADAPTP
jgi:hypothetical protein